MKIRWFAAAADDRRAQLDWLAERNPRAAIDIAEAIDRALLRLVDFPDSGRPGRVAGTRELVVAGTRFVIAYRVSPGTVTLIRLLHMRQSWPEVL